MFVVSVTKEEKMIYSIFSKLRKNFPNVKIITLRQISIYLEKTIDKIYDFCVNKMDNDNYEILLIDGRKIFFSENKFGFSILRKENDISMNVIVYEENFEDLSSVMVRGLIETSRNGMYVVDSVSNDCAHIGNINYYDNNLYVSTSCFNITPEFDSPLDCYDGCLSNFLTRIDLLYNNIKCVNSLNKIKRR